MAHLVPRATACIVPGVIISIAIYPVPTAQSPATITVASMTRDGEITAIFNPRRVRAPSVVVTGDSPNGGQFPAFTSIHTGTTVSGGGGVAGTPHLIHSDSIASGHPDGIVDMHHTLMGGYQHHPHSVGTPTPTNEMLPGMLPVQTAVMIGGSGNCAGSAAAAPESTSRCRESCCSDQVQKVRSSRVNLVGSRRDLIKFTNNENVNIF